MQARVRAAPPLPVLAMAVPLFPVLLFPALLFPAALFPALLFQALLFQAELFQALLFQALLFQAELVGDRPRRAERELRGSRAAVGAVSRRLPQLAPFQLELDHVERSATVGPERGAGVG